MTEETQEPGQGKTGRALPPAPPTRSKGNMSWPDDDKSGERPPARNGLTMAAMLLGLLSIVSILLLKSLILGVIAGLLGLIFGILGLRQVKRGIADRRGFALTGVVAGALGLIISVVLLILSYRVYNDCKHKLGHAPSSKELTRCVKNKS